MSNEEFTIDPAFAACPDWIDAPQAAAQWLIESGLYPEFHAKITGLVREARLWRTPGRPRNPFESTLKDLIGGLAAHGRDPVELAAYWRANGLVSSEFITGRR